MYKAILVDDEILVREAIGQNIDWNGLGFELVKDCANGKEAMEYLQSNPVDLVLTDIYMPYMDGLELSKYINDNIPNTVVVIFSGYGEFDYAKRAIQYNVIEYLLKPVTPKELIKVLENVHNKLEERNKKSEKMQRLEEAYTSYTKNESAIIANELSGLVKGTQDTQVSLNNLKKHGIELSGAYFRVAVIDIDIYTEGGTIDPSDKKESALMSFVVENISDEIVRLEHCGLAYRDKDGRVCVLLYTNKPREFERRVSKIFELIKKNVYDSMKLSLSVGIGKYVDKIEKLYDSYDSATVMMHYQYIKGSDIYFDYEYRKNELEASLDMSVHLKEVVNALKNENSSKYIDILEKIKQEIQDSYIEKNKAISYLHQIVLSAYGILIEVCGNKPEYRQERDDVITKIANAQNLNRSIKEVNLYCGQVFKELLSAKQPVSMKQANAAIEYLYEHYGEQDLGLSSICSYLNISTSHFSNIFKEVTGETFMECLTRIRMEKAKQLLRETRLKNYEIAERVGYSDPHYFNIAFKKITGQTPKAFAKENR